MLTFHIAKFIQIQFRHQRKHIVSLLLISVTQSLCFVGDNQVIDCLASIVVYLLTCDQVSGPGSMNYPLDGKLYSARQKGSYSWDINTTQVSLMCLYPTGFPTNILYKFVISYTCATCFTHLKIFYLVSLTVGSVTRSVTITKLLIV